MKKPIIFLLSILALIVVAIGFTFYDFDNKVEADFGNITFKKEGVLISRGGNRVRSQGTAFEKIYNTQYSSGRRVRIDADYRSKGLVSVANAGNVAGYVSGDLSLMTGSGQTRATLGNSVGNYRRYVADNSSSRMVTGVVAPQTLRIDMSNFRSSGIGGGIIATGPMMAAGCDHVFDPLNPDECGNGCGAVPTFPDGWGPDGIDENTKIEWTPIGDVVWPMMILCLGYVMLCFWKRRN